MQTWAPPDSETPHAQPQGLSRDQMNINEQKEWSIRDGERWEKAGESFKRFDTTLKAWSKVGMKCGTSRGHRKTACSMSHTGDKTETAGTIQIIHDDYFNLCMLGKYSDEPRGLCSSTARCFLCFRLCHAKSTQAFTTVSFPYLCTTHSVLMLQQKLLKDLEIL